MAEKCMTDGSAALQGKQYRVITIEAKLLKIRFSIHSCSLLCLVPFLNSPENKKGANLLVRHDQQIDASKIYLFGCKKTAPFLKTAASKRAPRWFNVANHRQSGVQIPSVARKGRLASMEKSVKFGAKKARKRLMPLALRQWHLYRLDFMVDLKRFELSTPTMRM